MYPFLPHPPHYTLAHPHCPIASLAHFPLTTPFTLLPPPPQTAPTLSPHCPPSSLSYGKHIMERWCEVATGPGSARSVREASATRRDAARERLEEKALRRAAKAADNAGLSNKASTASGIVTKSMITEEMNVRGRVITYSV